MSRNNRNDTSYATYATYNGSSNSAKSDIIMERYSNAPNPSASQQSSPQFFQGTQHPPQIRPPPNGSPKMTPSMENIMPNTQPFPSQPASSSNNKDDNRDDIDDIQENNRVKRVSPAKLYELLTNSQHFFVQQQQPLRIFIKVYTDWCKPCRVIDPFIKILSSQPDYYNILFLELNGDELIQDDKLASKLRVSAVPTFFGFIAGQAVGSVAGIEKEEIKKLCDKICEL